MLRYAQNLKPSFELLFCWFKPTKFLSHKNYSKRTSFVK